MEYYSSSAFVLKKEPIKESDRRYVFFTKDFGKISLLAQGARKIKAKLSGHLEPPVLSQIEFVVGNTSRLLGALEEEPYLEIKKDETALAAALEILALTDEMTIENQDDKALWKLIFDVLFFMEKNGRKYNELTDFSKFYFNARLLTLMGFKPFLGECSECHKRTENGFFNFRNKSFFCKNHAKINDFLIKTEQKRILDFFFEAPLNFFSQPSLVKKIMEEREFLKQFLKSFTLSVKSDILYFKNS